MYWIAQGVLWAWLPLVMLFFLWMSPRRAVISALLVSWLFLPQLGYTLPLIPDYTKTSATCYAIILGALLLDPKSRILSFKPLWIDVPMAVWCAVPLLTSINNELGLYDGASTMLDRTVQYGMPYLIGRLYFRTPDDAKDFCIGILLGGMVYVPLCLYEVRMSPQLHNMLYGFSPMTDWNMAQRWGGWRPTVFMRHGLAVGVWMAAAAALGFWLWRTKAIKDLFGVPMWVAAPLMILTAILAKSTGAIMLFFGVSAAMFAVRYLNTKAFMYALLLGVPLYLFTRVTQIFDGETFAQWLGSLSPALDDRASSLEYRMVHENYIVGHTAARPFFGWGGWGRAFEVYIPRYNSRAVPDSMWIRSYGQNGIIGLVSLYAMYIIPPIVLLSKLKTREWASAKIAPVTGLAMISLIYAMDALFNTMLNPVFIVATGGVAGMAASLSRNPASKPKPLSSRDPVGPPSSEGGDELTDGADDILIDLPPAAAPSGGPLVMIDPPRRDGPMRGGV
ncbi:MAG: O-antigen ligase domain-containing protein [Planctomycetota bacterium]